LSIYWPRDAAYAEGVHIDSCGLDQQEALLKKGGLKISKGSIRNLGLGPILTN
jgi:hypothetical protein